MPIAYVVRFFPATTHGHAKYQVQWSGCANSYHRSRFFSEYECSTALEVFAQFCRDQNIKGQYHYGEMPNGSVVFVPAAERNGYTHV